MKDGHELAGLLTQFCGGDEIYRHALKRDVVYTQGCRAFFRNAGNGAYWLLDILATEPAILNHVRTDGFGSVKLKVMGNTALLKVTDGNDDSAAVFVQNIAFTDCPEPPPESRRYPDGAWIFFMEPTEVGGRSAIIIMLPQER